MAIPLMILAISYIAGNALIDAFAAFIVSFHVTYSPFKG
jgi:hypothetical protein